MIIGEMYSLYYCLYFIVAFQVKPGGVSSSAADVATETSKATGGDGSIFGPFGGFFLPAMIVVMILYFLMLPKQQQKNEAEISELLKNLKKNDEVLTAAGIRGTVVNIRDGDYLTIRIDENTNTKMKILKKSVIRVLTNDDSESE